VIARTDPVDARWLTYDEIAAVLGIGSESARVLVRRKRWPRRAGNDGKARIGVPEEAIKARTDPPNDRADSSPNNPPSGPPNDRPSDRPNDRGNEPDHLTELRVLNARLETQIEALKAAAAEVREQAERERRLFEDALAEARAQRDEWQAQAKQLALTAPRPERRGWWPFRRAS
jgi:hypothetical protein